ncbi:hypothetical protein F4803DRAFT_548258 [Xylaria telfairii]|nr:hypothetical protein F4803DRAFT_548258 [Xylaria telfairii]
MSGSNSTAPAKATVLDAMMNDLGNNRIEELVEDNYGQSHSSLAPSFNSLTNKKPTQPRTGGGYRNGPAQKWNDAVAEGFNDDDAAGVSGLDPLDNGNAHRLSSGQLHSDKNRTFATTQTSKRPRYDPSQPTYRKGTPNGLHPGMGRSPRVSRHSSASNGNPHVSPLGGIGPDGGEVKRWDSGRRLNGTHHIDNPILNRSAGRGRPVPGERGSTSGQPVQTPSCGHGRGGSLPNPLHMNGSSRNTPTQQPQEGVGRGYSIPAHAQHVQMPEMNSIGSTSTPVAKVSVQALEVVDSQSHDASWVPPHLRKTSRSQSPISQNSSISQQSSPLASNKIPTLNAREIFLQQDVLVLPQCGTKKPTRGKIVVYELLDAPIGIWELIIEDEQKLIRGNLCELLEVLPDGSRAFLRRNKGGRVVSDPLRFSTVVEAKTFMNEVNLRRSQYSSSSEMLHTEATMEWPIQDGASRKTSNDSTEKAIQMAAAKPAETSGQKASESSLELPQSRQPQLNNPNPEEPRSERPRTQPSQPKIESRPQTPPISLPTAEVKTTPIKAAATSHVRTGSSGSDDNLISFSPVKGCSPPQSELRGIPVNYTAVKRMQEFLEHALENTHPRRWNPAYMASFLHLVGKDEFIAQSPTEQEMTVEALYTNIGGKDMRIILPPKAIFRLRSGEEACPEAIKEFNIQVKNWNDEHVRGPPQSLLSTKTSKIMPEKKNGENQGLSGPNTRGSSVQQPLSGVATATRQPASKDPTPSESSAKRLDKPSRGLMGSRWAQDEPEGTEQRSRYCGENMPTPKPPAFPGLDNPEHVVGRKASSHRRSSTNDTMTNLANQLVSLSVSSEQSSEPWA